MTQAEAVWDAVLSYVDIPDHKQDEVRGAIDKAIASNVPEVELQLLVDQLVRGFGVRAVIVAVLKTAFTKKSRPSP